MVIAWFDAARNGRTVALVTATHAEAQAISEEIQARRIESGMVHAEFATTGQADQPIFVGDIVQTRRNNSSFDVQNRQSWIVKTITADHVILMSASDASDLRKITHQYAGSHLHLGYATTVYGVQGETTDRSIVGPGVDASGLYVGLTRGKLSNSAVVIAATVDDARSILVETMERQPVEETMEKSRAAAHTELNRAALNRPDVCGDSRAPRRDRTPLMIELDHAGDSPLEQMSRPSELPPSSTPSCASYQRSATPRASAKS